MRHWKGLYMRTRIVLMLLIVCLLVLPSAFADGGFFIRDKDMWRLFTEEQQYCAINHKDGVQRMILTIDTADELVGDKAVWIFPVPAAPESTKIYIIKGFPFLAGYDLDEQADKDISSAYWGMVASQVYTFPFALLLSRGGFMMLGSGAARLSDKGYLEGVTVYETIEKMGLTTELVSATDADSFSKYAAKNKLTLPDNFESILKYYIGKDYSFVVSWISNISSFRDAQQIDGPRAFYRSSVGNTAGVFITFPTDKLYYPLKPTSVYGDKVVPAVIYVLDHVQPELYEGIRKNAEINYFYASSERVPDDMMEFYKGYEVSFFQGGINTINNISYTKIKINASANALTDDLWMNKTAPKKIVVLKSIINHSFLWGLMIFLLISMISSMIAGAIIFGGNRPSLIKFFFYGLTNLLSLVGFWFLSYLLRIESFFTDNDGIMLQEVKLTGGRKAAILIPIILLIISAILVPITLLLDMGTLYLPIIISPLFIIFMLPVLMFVPLILFGSFNRKKTLFFNLAFAGTFMLLLLLSRLLLSIII